MKSLERVSLKGLKAVEGFCASFWKRWEVSVDGPGETGASANLCTGAIHGVATTRRACQLLVILSVRGFEKIPNHPNWACVFLQSAFFFLLFPPPLASLFSADTLPMPAQCFSFVAHSNLNSWYQGEGSKSGYLRVKQSLGNYFSGATQVTRLL